MTSLDFTTISYFLGILGILGVIFSVYNYFKKPQEALDKRQAVDQVSIDNKAMVLAADLLSEKQSTEKRFAEMGARMDKALELAMNHTHTVDVKCDKLLEGLNLLSLQVARLETKIDERIPRKNI